MTPKTVPQSVLALHDRPAIGQHPVRRQVYRYGDRPNRLRGGLRYTEACRLVADGVVRNVWRGPGGAIAISAADQIVLRRLVAEVARNGSESCAAGEHPSANKISCRTALGTDRPGRL